MRKRDWKQEIEKEEKGGKRLRKGKNRERKTRKE